MKVVCIIVLFVIVAGNESAAGEADAPKAAKRYEEEKCDTSISPVIFLTTKNLLWNFWKFVIITKLPLDSRSSDAYYAINDKHVNFKNCTFLCKHSPDLSVTLDLPENTPCGPNGQTCADKTQCVGYIPGC
uniref:Putative ixodes 8-cys protein n=1 Tax=Ixodes ricinus TaxID=34613 RepID=A0A0K8RIS9_IXORI